VKEMRIRVDKKIKKEQETAFVKIEDEEEMLRIKQEEK